VGSITITDSLLCVKTPVTFHDIVSKLIIHQVILYILIYLQNMSRRSENIDSYLIDLEAHISLVKLSRHGHFETPHTAIYVEMTNTTALVVVNSRNTVNLRLSR
jgi:hypothetical protein